MSKKTTESDFSRLRRSVGLGRQEKAKEFLEISLRTLQRWDKGGAPPWAMRLLRFHDRWDCAAIGPEWAGFRFSRGALIHAGLKLRFRPEGLKHWPDTLAMLANLEAEAANRRTCPVMGIVRKVIGWAGKTTQRRQP